jgi:hypothetical protein
MRNRNTEKALAVLFVFLALSLILAGCSLTGTQGDPYSAGQKARMEFDKMSKEASDFVAGFCNAAPLPAAAVGLVVVLRRTKKG